MYLFPPPKGSTVSRLCTTSTLRAMPPISERSARGRGLGSSKGSRDAGPFAVSSISVCGSPVAAGSIGIGPLVSGASGLDGPSLPASAFCAASPAASVVFTAPCFPAASLFCTGVSDEVFVVCVVFVFCAIANAAVITTSNAANLICFMFSPKAQRLIQLDAEPGIQHATELLLGLQRIPSRSHLTSQSGVRHNEFGCKHNSDRKTENIIAAASHAARRRNAACHRRPDGVLCDGWRSPDQDTQAHQAHACSATQPGRGTSTVQKRCPECEARLLQGIHARSQKSLHA